MQRGPRIVFVVALLALSWFGMMAVHELGHVIGALATGGRVERVVLHPLSISRTDVVPNPHPSVVVWMGPVLGCLLPIMGWLSVPCRWRRIRTVLMFFAGFCLLANGAYIGIGAADQVGDCRVMLQHGSPLWHLLTFGLVAIAIGFAVWHRLGSPMQFLSESDDSDFSATCVLVAILVAAVVCEVVFSAR